MLLFPSFRECELYKYYNSSFVPPFLRPLPLLCIPSGKIRSGFTMEKTQSYGAHLIFAKGDLISKILVRLPVESLGQCKMVSKAWCALIESSFFIDLHTTFNNNSSSSSNKFGAFILLASLDHKDIPKTVETVGEHSVIMLSSEPPGSGSGGRLWSTGSNQEDDDELVFKVDNNSGGEGGGGRGRGRGGDQQLVFRLHGLGFPSEYKFYRNYPPKEIVGSCNGVVCLYDSILKEVSLWNPTTRQFRILPKSIPIDNCPRRLVAFGFDVETKDYKVVLFRGFSAMFYRTVSPVECPCRVQVYSLSTDSWRLLEGITCLPGDPFRFPSEILYLNGSCFFLANFFHTKQQPCMPENDRFIISFDFTKEIITPIQLPDHHEDQKLYLSCFADKIALFTICYTPLSGTDSTRLSGYDDYNIWVLNEHGSSSSSSSSVNKDSWKKIRFFQIKVKGPFEYSLPKGISNDGEFALLQASDSTGLGKKKMNLYHFASKEVKTNFLSCSLVKSRAYAYKPSLVSIISGKGDSTG